MKSLCEETLKSEHMEDVRVQYVSPATVYTALIKILYDTIIPEKQAEMKRIIFGQPVESINEAIIHLADYTELMFLSTDDLLQQREDLFM